MRLSALSLFAGCGGSDLGLKSAGVEVIWANEKNESACDFYSHVTGSSRIEHCDITRLEKFPKADLLVGCYPCQGYSQGGRRKSDASINFLYRQFDRALRQVKPRGFIVENVDGMRFSQNSSLLVNQITRFRSAGYRVKWNVLNAQDFGVAQTRRRLFIVGVRTNESGVFEFPSPTHGVCGNPHLCQRDAIHRFRKQTNGTYNQDEFHWYYLSRNRRREWHEAAATVVAKDRHVALHPDSPPLRRLSTDKWEFIGDMQNARRLSYLECAALQGFPDPKVFCRQTLRLRYRAIGNAVPPPLFAAVTRQMLLTLDS